MIHEPVQQVGDRIVASLNGETLWLEPVGAYAGGQRTDVDAPLDRIPLLLRGDAELPIVEDA